MGLESSIYRLKNKIITINISLKPPLCEHFFSKIFEGGLSWQNRKLMRIKKIYNLISKDTSKLHSY